MTTNWAPDTTPASAASSPRSPRRAPWGVWAILLIAVLLGGYFRTMSLFDWDEPSLRLHPDERFMLMVAGDIQLPGSFSEYLDSSINPLNPRNRDRPFYVYGLFPQTLTRYVAVALTPNDKLPETVRHPQAAPANALPQIPNPEREYPKLPLLGPLLNPDGENLTSFYYIHKVGRSLMALFDVGSIVLVFLLAGRLYGRRAGALASLLYACAVLPIQLSHFFAVDPATAFFALLAAYFAVRISQDGGAGSYVALGVSIGAAMACRVTLATLGVLGMIAVAQRVWPRRDAVGEYVRNTGQQTKHVGLLMLAGALSVLTFRLLQPDAFMGTSFFDVRPDPRFIDNLAEIQRYVSGKMESPPSYQWADRVPYWFPWKNMVLWGMGAPLGLVAWTAWAAAGWQMLRRRTGLHLVPWMAIALYFLWQGGILNPSMRYFVVLYGFFASFAAWGLLALWDWAMLRRKTMPALWPELPPKPGVRWPTLAAGALIAVVVVGTFLWAYAFTRIYTQPHSRITASRWIYANIPPNANVSNEAWDDALPLNLDGLSSSRYFGITMHSYAEDDPQKYIDFSNSNGVIDHLDQLDYVILSSNRVYGSIERMPMRFPALMNYYRTLFNGELGFELVADFHSYPNLFGIDIPDQSAEEAFSVYDHPRVLIFKKTPAYSHERAVELITGDVAWGEVYKMWVLDVLRMPTALRLTDAEWPVYRAAGTWSQLFDPASLSNKVPWLFWLLALELLGLAIFPLLFRLLPGLPDRGFTLAKSLGLLSVAYAAWLLGSLNLRSFTPGTLWLCAAVLIGVGALAARGHVGAIRAFVRSRKRALIAAEVLFLVAYFGFVLLRSFNPDLWHPARGGEKPMDLAFLNAVLKSASFPPYDPWFAGGYLNYYYFGFVLVGALVHLTGIVPTVAYNLAVPTVFALTALGAWGAAYNLLAPRLSRRAAAVGQWLVREQRAIRTGIVSAVFVVLLGTLANAIWLLPGSATPYDPREPMECQLSSYAAKELCKGRSEWVFWDATRQISLSLSSPTSHDSTINEFPFFTFLYGDLHAHMIALVLAVTALGLMVALARLTHQQSRRWLPSLGVIGFLALTIGALRVTNTWDYPAYLGLSIITIGLVAWQQLRLGFGWRNALLTWASNSMLLVVLATVLFQPFTSHFATDYAGFVLWQGARTPIRDYLMLHGLWLFLLVSAAIALYHRRYGLRMWHWMLIGAAIAFLIAAVLENILALYIVAPLAILAAGFGTELLLTSPAESNEDAPPSPLPVSLSTQLPVLWGVAALWLTLMVELIAARGDIGRMNTFFKLGMQSWVLFAITAAIGLPWVWRSVVPYASRHFAVQGAGLAWRVVASLLIVGALAFPLTATPARLGDRYDRAVGITLDGAAYMRSPNASWAENGIAFSLSEDADAMDWLRANVSGTPILLEAHTEAYRWGGRISIYTGLPTLLGWHGHERQQRAVAGVDSALENRRVVINQLYTSTVPTETLTLLQRYGVEYVYVGQLERALYGASGGLETLDGMAANGQLQRVYQRGSTSIYQLLPSANPPALLTTSAKLETPSKPATKTNQLLLPVDQLPELGDYAWNRLAASQPIAVLLWLLFSYLLLLLGLPLATLVFGRRLPASAEPSDEELDGAGEEEAASALSAASEASTEAAQAGPVASQDAQQRLNVDSLAAPDGIGEEEAASVRDAASDGAREVAQAGSVASQDAQQRLNVDSAAAPDEMGEEEAASASNAASDGAREVAQARPVASQDAQQRLSVKPAETPMLSAIGYAWARLIGLLLLGYAVWLPVSARLLSYNRLSIVIGIVLVALLNVVLLAWLGRAHRTSPDADGFDIGASVRNGYGVLLANLIAQRQHILLIEGLFLLVFALMTLLRMFNPDLWQPILGGEKPFEFGFLNAILRSPVMPPYDPFYSGNTINYYYYGLFLASLPIKATGIAPAVGFNLAIALFYAMTFIGGFAVVQRLTNTVRYGLAGALLLAVLGNLAANFQVGSSRGLAPIIDAIRHGGFTDLGARIGDWFWGPSRVIMNESLTTINEFPFWTFLFADLHPHLIALPITVLVIALIYELFDRSASAEHPLAGWRLFGLQALFTSFVLGSLAVTNSWDVPTYALLLAGALFGLAWRNRTRPGFPWLGSIGALLLSVLMVGTGLVFYLSFFQNFQAPVGGIGRVTTTTPLKLYAYHYGVFLAMLIPLVYVGLWRLLGMQRRGAELVSLGVERQRDASALGIAARPSGGQSIWQRLQLSLILVPILLGFALSRPAISLQVWLAALLVMSLCLLLSRSIRPTVWFTLLMVALAWAVSLGIELFYIRDHLDGGGAARMNTVFKFGNQIWTLMALATAASLPLLFRWLRRQHWLIQSFVSIVVTVLFLLTLTFPIFGTLSRSALRFPIKPGLTLDGLAFMETAEFDVSARDMGLPDANFPIHLSLRGDLEAIRWLNETIKGTPMVLQSDLWFYRTYGTRVSANTGLPTIVSPLHASEQHDPRLVAERDMHVQAIYRSPDVNQTLQLLARYRVGYIYVGQIERAAYGEVGMQKFDSLVGSYLSVVYDRDGVRIYRVQEGVYTLAVSDSETISLPSLPVQVVTPSVPNTPGQSLEALEEQVRQNPTVASLAFGLGQMYYMEGRVDDAIRVLERAAVANPSDVALQQVYGDVLRDAGRNDEAAAAYRTAAQAAPSAGNYNKLGMHLLDTGSLDEASDAFLQAIANDANVPEPYFYLGQIYEQQAQANQALDYYRMYLDIAPPDGPLRPEAEAALARLQ